MVVDGNDASYGQRHNGRLHILIYIFLSISLYNVVELAIHVVTTFKHFRGLYCWSFLVATAGIALFAVGSLLREMGEPFSPYMFCTLIIIGWLCMITGQSLVLYSRLHIVLHWQKLLRWVLIMIVANSVWLGVPVVVLIYLTASSPDSGPYVQLFNVFEKIQLTVIFVQEAIISGIYISETYKLLRSYRGLSGSGSRRTMTYLMLINLLSIALNISILCLLYTNNYDFQTAWKPFVYSLKLKSEFSVLNRLVEMSQHVRRSRGLTLMGGMQMDATSLSLDVMHSGITTRRQSLNDASIYSKATSSGSHMPKVHHADTPSLSSLQV